MSIRKGQRLNAEEIALRNSRADALSDLMRRQELENSFLATQFIRPLRAKQARLKATRRIANIRGKSTPMHVPEAVKFAAILGVEPIVILQRLTPEETQEHGDLFTKGGLAALTKPRQAAVPTTTTPVDADDDQVVLRGPVNLTVRIEEFGIEFDLAATLFMNGQPHAGIQLPPEIALPPEANHRLMKKLFAAATTKS